MFAILAIYTITQYKSQIIPVVKKFPAFKQPRSAYNFPFSLYFTTWRASGELSPKEPVDPIPPEEENFLEEPSQTPGDCGMFCTPETEHESVPEENSEQAYELSEHRNLVLCGNGYKETGEA